jgi:hypothetical protein
MRIVSGCQVSRSAVELDHHAGSDTAFAQQIDNLLEKTGAMVISGNGPSDSVHGNRISSRLSGEDGKLDCCADASSRIGLQIHRTTSPHHRCWRWVSMETIQLREIVAEPRAIGCSFP